MMERHEVALHRMHGGKRCDEALEDLRDQLGEDAVEDPDETGFFAVAVEADSFDAAVRKVRDAIAATGADECFELGESRGR